MKIKDRLCSPYLPRQHMLKESAWCVQGASTLLGCCKLLRSSRPEKDIEAWDEALYPDNQRLENPRGGRSGK